MRSPRVSLAETMLVIAVVAVEVAALRTADFVWVDACRLLTASLLVYATFRARGGAGDFWFGFAAVGWAVLVLAPQTSSGSVLLYLPLRLLRSVTLPRETDDYAASLQTTRRLLILHLIQVPLLGLLGGVVGGWVLQRSRRATESG